MDELLLAALGAHPADALIAADREGVVRYWNRGAEAIFGHTAGEAIGASLDLIIPEKLRAGHWAGFDRALSTGEMKYAGRVLTTRAMHKDGRTLYVELSFGLVRSPEGRIVGSLAIARDGTSRHLAGRELKTRVEAAERQLAKREP